jgi:hypothetical protein
MTNKSGLQPDGTFRTVEGTGTLEVALARNGRQVCLRRIQEPTQSIIVDVASWSQLLAWLRESSAGAVPAPANP